MEFLNFLTGTDNSSIDLSELKFISDDHIRHQNGQDISGHNYGCGRGIRVQKNISGSQGYTVTVYNLDGNHPVWGNNIQMAPKQMKIIEQNSKLIKLKGFGADEMGASFADYGLSLHLNNKLVEKVTLHMHDRNVDIVYFKAPDNTPKQETKSSTTKPAVLTAYTNIYEILELSDSIHACPNVAALHDLYRRFGDYNHPQISYDFGVGFLIKGDKVAAKKCLIKGAIYGVQYPCSIYSHPLIDSVGQCFSILMTQYPTTNRALAMKTTILGYIYLSRCIELALREAQDSYRTRAILFKDHEVPGLVQALIANYAGLSVTMDPYIISDFYFASQATGTPHQSSLQSAIRLHEGLRGITIGGKDGENYSLEEMAELGERRHLSLFKNLENKYMQGAFNLTVDELKSLS